jgi:APA family basic amino acid/polyamine antiporter
MWRRQLFVKKSLQLVLEEMAGEHRLRRVLGPVALSSLGIGAIIGTGIFVLTGVAARKEAGPGLILSFVIAGLACAFAALCYAEFASMAPIAGSAYTYAYVTLGELVAWVIGWDLVLEYAMAAATVANGWSNYFLKFLDLDLFQTKAGKALVTLPFWLTIDPFTAASQHVDHHATQALVVASATAEPIFTKEEATSVTLPVAADSPVHRVKNVAVSFTAESIAKAQAELGEAAPASIKRIQKALEDRLQYEPKTLPAVKLKHIQEDNEHGFKAYETTPLVIGSVHLSCNIVAVVITTIITTILVVGIRESAGFNATMVIIKIAAVLFVIVAGIGYIDARNWTPFLPYGWSGVFSGAAIIFFAYIGFDSVSTHAEEARNPKRDVPIGIISSLAVCTVLYIVVAAVVTGMVPYPEIDIKAPILDAFKRFALTGASVVITVGALTGITSVLLVMLLSQPRVFLAMARDGLLSENFFGAVHPRFRTPHKATILTGAFCAVASSFFPLEGLSHMVNIGTLFAFVVVCGSVWLMRRINPAAERPFRSPAIWLVAPGGILMCLILMASLPRETWLRLLVWLAVGLSIYVFYGRHHSHLGKALRGEISRHGVSPAGMPLDGPSPEQNTPA